MNSRNGRMRRAVLAASAVALSGAALVVVAARTPASVVQLADGTLERTSSNAGASGGRETPAVSSDGRHVVFVGRGTEGQGVWAVDRRTGVTHHLTSGDDMNPDISDTGRFVAYTRRGGSSQVYLLDRDSDGNGVFDEAGKTKTYTVSVDQHGAAGGAPSDNGVVSADGRFVAFQSMAELDATPACQSGGGPTKVYVWDRTTQKPAMVSVARDEAGQLCAVNGNATLPSITPDGRFVTFTSDASVLMPPAPAVAAGRGEGGGGEEETTSAPAQVFVHDRVSHTTTLVSVAPDGSVGDGPSGSVRGATISGNGRFIAFESDAANLVTGDTNANTDAFVRDMTAHKTVRVSGDSAGNQVTLPALTGDPCVSSTTSTSESTSSTSESTTSTTAGGGGNGGGGDTTSVALPAVGAGPAISGDGRYVAYESEAPLTADDQNEVDGVRVRDVYRFDMTTKALVRVSAAAPNGSEATGCRLDGHTGQLVPAINGTDAQISADGRMVVFGSQGDLTFDRPAETEEGVTEPSTTAFETATFTRTYGSPTITAVNPNKLPRGYSGLVVVTGTNFTPPGSPGGTTVTFGSGIVVQSVTWVSPTTLNVIVKVPWDAALGPRTVSMKNPAGDGATRAGAVTVIAVPVSATGGISGYRLAASDGGVFVYGSAKFYGSMGGTTLNRPVVGIAETRTGLGYYLVASDGGVFAFGDAKFYGSTGGMKLNQPIVGIDVTVDGKGYYLVASDGGVFAFGSAKFYGSMGGTTLNQPVVGIEATSAGYRMVASDGGMFSFGDAKFYGSLGGIKLSQPIVGVASVPHGYWLGAGDGGVFAFGDAKFLGSATGKLSGKAVAILALANETGYRIVSATGDVKSFGVAVDFGDLSAQSLRAPIVGMSG